MAEFKAENTTHTNLAGTQGDYSIPSQSPDKSEFGEYQWDYPDADKYTGFYKSSAFLKKATDAYSTWCTGRGFTSDSRTQAILEGLRGMGEDNFLSIIRNLIVQKKIQGDAYAEIVRDPKDSRLLNLKPLYTGDMTIVVGKDGMIKHYFHKVGENPETKMKPEDVLHFSNDRYANEIHGTSIIDCVEWMLNAIEEALKDSRVIYHRNRTPVRIIEVDHDDTSKLASLKNQYEQAIKKGEVLLVPKGVVEIKDTTIQIQDPTNWINYLESTIYIALGVPKVVLGGSSQSTEASAKIDYLTFEEVYNREHEELEADLWNQLGLRVEFNKPASLQQQQQQSEAANTGQVGFQQNDTEVGVGRQ